VIFTPIIVFLPGVLWCLSCDLFVIDCGSSMRIEFAKN
jgi:hypothetical protein